MANQTQTPAISDSALLALYVMEMTDGAQFSLMFHGVNDEMREHVLGRLVENGWTRDDNPSNRDNRGAQSPNGDSIDLWP